MVLSNRACEEGNGKWHFCVDYRKLNKITKDVYPLPRIDDAMESLTDANFFYMLCFTSGYWKIEVGAKKNCEKNSIRTLVIMALIQY